MQRSCFPFHPLSLALVGGLCVQKLLLCYLFISKFPFTSLLLHLSLFILWNSSVKKNWFMSIYLLAPLFIYPNMDSQRVFFSFGWKLNAITVYFTTQIVPALAMGSSFSWPLLWAFSLRHCSFDMTPYFFLSTSLLPGITRCSRLIFHFPCPSPRISHFPKDLGIPFLGFLSWKVVARLRSQDGDVESACCYWG